MSLPRYPEYKDSGVEWLGEVPAHWEIRRLSSLFVQVTEEGDTDLPVLMVSIHSGVSDDEIDEEERSRKVTRSEDRSKYKRVAPGDLVYNMMRAWQGGFGTATVTGLVSPAYVVARPTETFQTHLVEQQLRSPQAVEEMRRHSRGVTDFRLRLYWDEFKTLSITLPPATEQTAIAAFLDRETAKIDALIAEQDKLLALLTEKRQATISHAVTKGLDPNVSMKDSGVKWLGEVPRHWKLMRIRHLVSTIEQGWSPQCENFPVEAPDEWGVLKVGCVNGGFFRPSENKKLPLELAPMPAYALKRGDLLISRANTRELVGSAAVVQRDFNNLLLCDKLYRLRLAPGKCLAAFAAAYLSTREARSQIELDATGASSSMLNIGQSAVLDLLMPLPVMDEQKAIAEFISAETARLDALAAEATRAIALLKERRSALISAAVTGKIDVRNALQNRKPAMREGLSHRIVAFIANLLPIYTNDWIGDRHCARSLIDGTLILPVEEPEEDEEGWVEVHWQGDPARSTKVQGEFMASIAVARYVEITAVPDSATTKAGYAHLFQHFTFKTGASLVLEEPDPESAVAEMLKEAIKLLGKEAVKEIVKTTASSRSSPICCPSTPTTGSAIATAPDR